LVVTGGATCHGGGQARRLLQLRKWWKADPTGRRTVEEASRYADDPSDYPPEEASSDRIRSQDALVRYLVAPPIFCAVAAGDSESVLTLIAAKANLTKQSSDGQTALGAACRLGNRVLAQSLLDAGVDPCLPNGEGVPPIFEAICAATEVPL